MTNFGKYSVIIFASETPTQTEIVNALRAASLGIIPVWIADTVSPDNIKQLNSTSKTITFSVKDATVSKVVKGKYTKKKSTKGTGRKPGRN